MAQMRTMMAMAVRHFTNPLALIPLVFGRADRHQHVVRLRDGSRIGLRGSIGMSVPDLDILHELLVEDQYELVRTIRSGDTVVDIGAHVGIFSVLAARRCGATGEVLAFEPEERNVRMLRANVARNRGLPIRVFHQAVAGAPGRKALRVCTRNSGGHRLTDQPSDGVLVDCTSLSAILEATRHHRIDVLKLDCEGGEFEIFASIAPHELERIGSIVMEVHDAAYTPAGAIASMMDRLGEAGFAVETLRTMSYPDEGQFRIVRAVRRPNADRTRGKEGFDGPRQAAD